MKISGLIVVISLLSSAGDVSADSLMAWATPKVNAQFVVSGMLRSGVDGIVIKLIQGVEVASSPDEAVGAFTRQALEKYPGYALVDTLATRMPPAKPTCERAI